MTLPRWVLIGLAMISLVGCSSKKVVAKHCERAEHKDVWVCESL